MTEPHGAGKTTTARLVHELGGGGPLVRVCCASSWETSGPLSARVLWGSTLLLEEIGAATVGLQREVLGLVERAKSSQTFRLIATSHRNIEQSVRRDAFLAALLAALSPVIWLPPLRTRRDDVALLARQFAREICAEHDIAPFEFDEDSMEELKAQSWPGNVRQLRDFVTRVALLDRTAVLDGEELLDREVPSHVDVVRRELRSAARFRRDITARTEHAMGLLANRRAPDSAELAAAERRGLVRTLEHARGNEGRAVRLLRISSAFLGGKAQRARVAMTWSTPSPW